MAQNVYGTCIRTIDRGTWTRAIAIEKVTAYNAIGALTDAELEALLDYIDEKLPQ